MIRTITIDIIHEKALNLLKDLEDMRLIRLRKDKLQQSGVTDWANKYKGTMSKQPIREIDKQLTDLRNEWE